MPAPTCQMRVCFIFIFCLLVLRSYAQDSTLYFHAGVSAAASTDQTPFWQYANRNGNVPANGNFGLANVSIHKIYNPNNPRIFQWSGGIQAIGYYGTRGDVFLSDAYAAAKIRFIEIMAGQKNMVTGLMDTTLTSGSLSISGNARPLPRIQISIPDYHPLYITDGFLSIKFAYSDGYLGSSQLNYGTATEVPHTYLHQKSLYLRLGKKLQRWKIYAGMNHQAMWGGEDKTIPLYELQPSKAYWYTISGKTVGYRKVGNHFGTMDIGGEWKSPRWSYFLYRQGVYETGSLFRPINFEDGLNGIRIRRTTPSRKDASYFVLQSFLFEVLGTKNQTNDSPLSGLAIFQQGNYYNSYVYRRGWSYFGNGLGTPLLSAVDRTRGNLPRSNAEFTNNNRVWAFHTGITASWAHIKFGFKGTYSRNYGSYVSAFDNVKQQVSLLLNAEKDLKLAKGCTIFASYASDIGELYPDSHGLLVGIRKGMFLD